MASNSSRPARHDAARARRLTERETNHLIFRLEERKYGQRLNSLELAQKANVSLDDVNRVERQLPLDAEVAEKIAEALGISPELLGKIAGLAEIAATESQILESCFCLSPDGAQVPSECQRLGFRRVYR